MFLLLSDISLGHGRAPPARAWRRKFPSETKFGASPPSLSLKRNIFSRNISKYTYYAAPNLRGFSEISKIFVSRYPRIAIPGQRSVDGPVSCIHCGSLSRKSSDRFLCTVYIFVVSLNINCSCFIRVCSKYSSRA